MAEQFGNLVNLVESQMKLSDYIQSIEYYNIIIKIKTVKMTDSSEKIAI